MHAAPAVPTGHMQLSALIEPAGDVFPVPQAKQLVIAIPALELLYVFATHVVHGASPVALQVPGPHLQPVRALTPATLYGELAGQARHEPKEFPPATAL